jgi:hypothetical protein
MRGFVRSLDIGWNMLYTSNYSVNQSPTARQHFTSVEEKLGRHRVGSISLFTYLKRWDLSKRKSRGEQHARAQNQKGSVFA